MIASSATGFSALFYLAMGQGFSKIQYTGADGVQRVGFDLRYVERFVGVALVIFNVGVLARDRRTAIAGSCGLWALSVAALYIASKTDGGMRTPFFGFSFGAFVPMICIIACFMGRLTLGSNLQTPYRFLATWILVCCFFYFGIFAFAELTALVDSETEIILYALMDVCTVSVTSWVISFCAHHVPEKLLPMEEKHMSQYPGPAGHGFHPNYKYDRV